MNWTDDRRSALLAIAPPVLLLAFVAHHPMVAPASTVSPQALVDGLNRIATVNSAFHAMVLALVAAQAIGLHAFARTLGSATLWVRFGLLLYGVALVLLVLAGTLDGFATPLLARRCIGQAAACADRLSGPFAVESAAIQAFTKVGLAAQSIALVCWSVAWWRGAGSRWRIGAPAVLLGAAPVAVLAGLEGSIGPAQLAATVVSASLWSVGAGLLLWTGRAGAATPAAPSSAV